MTKKVDELSAQELHREMYRRRRAERQNRRRRLKEQGRVVDMAGLEPPDAPLAQSVSGVGGSGKRPSAEGDPSPPEEKTTGGVMWGWVWNRLLLTVEVGAAVAVIVVVAALIWSVRDLNREAALVQAQGGQPAAVALPTEAAPQIDLVVLPSGHQPPVEGRPIVYREAGDIPEHLLPLVDAYVPPPIPTPSPQQPRRVQIPGIDVDASVVQGDTAEQLKKGVGHHVGSAMPGEPGNMVLSAHNDIYGEIFRHLDKLAPGDEITVSTGRESYTYIIHDIRVVEPTAVEVMNPTEHASLTLISCYPYLINNKRIVVFADLVDEA